MLRQLVDYQPPAEETDEGEAARPYSRQRVIRWELNLDREGRFLRIVSLADPSERATKFGVPVVVPNVSRTSGVAPALGVDDAQYVLGWCDSKAKPERVREAHAAFIELTRRWLREFPDDPAARAMVAFYDRNERPALLDEAKSKDLVVVKVAGSRVTDRDSLWTLWEKVVRERKSGGTAGNSQRRGLCLVCGSQAALLDRLPQALPKVLIPRAEQEIALVSANKRIHTYDYAEGLVSSPICVDCGSAAVTNLHAILNGEHSTFTFAGQRSRLIWWATKGVASKTILLLSGKLEEIRDHLHSLASGRPVRRRADTADFQSVTLSGNVARLVVHRWVTMPLAEAEANVDTWFFDHQILARSAEYPSGFPIWLLVLCAGQWQPGDAPNSGRYIQLHDKAADRPDDLAQLLLHSALHGDLLPAYLLAHVVRRVRTDLRIDGPRAALLRVALNRHPLRKGEGPAAVLDEKQDNPAYLYGRLFAVLESLQHRAYPGDELPNATFFHRYFAGAVANPRVALAQGCQLSAAWLKKLDSKARIRNGEASERTEAQRAAKAAYRFRERLRSLHDRLDGPVTPLGDAESQSWFVLGYFHQQAHDIRMARAGKAPEVPVEELTLNETDSNADLPEGNDQQ
ncbi:type I-C CRISPR-associated protein Cas8c/Csd1 [Micromonospora endophytica]|nr:type I-C CRISPR-associated protein Cas8c/Csd1 [Micromonospora endophytica]BCJ58212.1 CRISPR-associated Csd1 family protein [Micromonospora endophytica]